MRKNINGDNNRNINIETYKEIVQHAHEQIDWVKSAYKWIAGLTGLCLTIIISVGLFFTYQNIKDYKEEIKSEFEPIKKSIQDELEYSKRKMKFDYELEASMIRENIKKKIQDEFDEENIKNLVTQEAKNRVDLIADKLIDEEIAIKINPRMKSIDAKLGELNKELENAKQIQHFLVTVISAQNDDRIAFDKLRELSQDITYPLRKEAYDAWFKILDEREDVPLHYLSYPWPKDINPSEFSLAELKNEFYKAPIHLKTSLMEYIYNRKDIPKINRLEFLIEIIKTESNLITVQKAGEFFRDKTGRSRENIKPLDIENHLKWWVNNKNKIK